MGPCNVAQHGDIPAVRDRMAHNHTALVVITVVGAIVFLVKWFLVIFCKKLELRMPGSKDEDSK